MRKPAKSLEVPPNTKAIDERVAKRVRSFLLMWLRRWYPSSGHKGFNGSKAGAALGLSPGYLSDLTNPSTSKRPGLDVVLRLRERSGASFEEITGHYPPTKPKYPLSLSLAPNAHIAEAAAEEAVSAPADEKSSDRGSRVGGTRKRTPPKSTPPIR